MPQTVSVNELTDIVARIFLCHGVSEDNVTPVALTVTAAERDGSLSHGLLRLPGYVATLRSGWVDGRAVPVVVDAAPGLVAIDAANGFAQPGLHASSPLFRDKARRQGIAAAAIRDSHHFARCGPTSSRLPRKVLSSLRWSTGGSTWRSGRASKRYSAPTRWRLPARVRGTNRWYGTRPRA